MDDEAFREKYGDEGTKVVKGAHDDEPAMSFEERRSRMREFAERAKDMLQRLE